MTQTIGFWCDDCRAKYVQHVCKDGLPCGHDKARAVHVYAKAYGKGGEQVEMKWAGGHVSMWLLAKKREPNVLYCGQLAHFLHGYQVETEDGTVSVLAWLRVQEEKIIRAFLSRWNSCKEPPDWRRIRLLAIGSGEGGKDE